jgi:hypothetical protein
MPAFVMRWSMGGLWAVAWVCTFAPPAFAADQYRLFPATVELRGPADQQRLLVERFRDGEAVGDATVGAQFRIDPPTVARIEAGVLRPVADGTARLRAVLDGQTLEARVEVRGMAQADPPGFRLDVQPVLTRWGCNMGACHGAQAGKKSFKLSLRGYDPFADYAAITRQWQGRRIDLTHPDESLLLRKALGELAHGGGSRLDAEDPDFQVLRNWVATGAAPPREGEPQVAEIEVTPNQVTLTAGAKQPLLVQAVYSDGRRRDVTGWAKFASTESGVAQVDEDGVVTVSGQGEAAITVWFSSRVAIANVTVPLVQKLEAAQPVDAAVFDASPRVNFIDELVVKKLRRLNIPPSGQAGDAEFLRRAFLDTLGVLPSPAEVEAFLGDAAPEKRQRLVDQLLQRPEFVDYWTYKWSDLLLVSSRRLKNPAVWSFSQWIRGAVERNLPWNEFARQIVTAQGSTLENGAANYFVLHKDPKKLNEATTLTFLGLSIGCAQCHDHPLERWTQDDYYGMAALFARVRAKDTGTDGESVVVAAETGDLPHPTRVGLPIPRPLDGAAVDPAATGDRRQPLADWLTAPANPYFAKALVNRVWANFMGRGLVEMVDDLRATNPPSNPELLDALARHFIDTGYDVRALVKTILLSAAYQRSSVATPQNAADDRFYSHFLLKRMSAEVLLDSFSQVTAVPTAFPDYPAGLRALQLPDNNVTSYFLSAFGRPVREFTCECERTSEPSVTQTLHLANGKTLNEKLGQPANQLQRWLEQSLSPADLVRQVYLTALSRPPTAEEQARLVPALAEIIAANPDDAVARQKQLREALEDLLWAVLTCREFLFIH